MRAPVVTGPVVASTSLAARVAAGVGLLAALLLAAAVLPGYAVVGGTTADSGALDTALGLLWPLLLAAAAVTVLAGRVPRFGLAFLGAAGALGPGLLLQRLYAWEPVSGHRAVEVLGGRRLITSSYEPGPGAGLAAVGAGVLVLTLILVLLAWPRTPMEDDEAFDSRRQVALGVSAFAGLLGVLAVSARGIAAPAVLTQDAIGFRTSVEVAADVAVLERVGLDRAGGLVLGIGVVLVALVAAGLRPRLAVVGALAGLGAWALPAGLVLVAQAARFDDVVPGLGAWLFLVSGALFVGLALWARTAAPRDPGEPVPGGLGSAHPGNAPPEDVPPAGLAPRPEPVRRPAGGVRDE